MTGVEHGYRYWWGVVMVFVMVIGVLYYHTVWVQGQIPRRVFQTWHTHDLPPRMRACVDRLREQHPGWEFALYDDQECRDFLVAHFDVDVVAAYDRLIPGAFRADLWRYCVLWVYGGVYLDIKYECVGGFRLDDLVVGGCWCGCRKDVWVHEDDDRLVYTGLLVRPARCPKMWNCIRRVVANVSRGSYGRSYTSPTGPDLVGNFFTGVERRRLRSVVGGGRDGDRGGDGGRRGRKGPWVLYYYDDRSGTDGTKRGHIRCLRTGDVVLSHYPEYRVEQAQYGKTEYWIDLWFRRAIYREAEGAAEEAERVGGLGVGLGRA